MKGLIGKSVTLLNVETVENRMQNALLTAIDNNITLKVELVVRSINASSGRDATSIRADSERGERTGLTASFENVSENNNVLHISLTNDETRKIIPDEVKELSVPGTHFHRQSNSHPTDVCHFRFLF